MQKTIPINQKYSIKNHPPMKSFFYGLFCLFLMLGTVPAFAQIGIGTKTPAASAALEVTSSTNNKGILIPRVTATQKDAIVSPAEGLLIYQTTAPAGFYYYTGSAWKLLAGQTDVASKVDKVDGKDLSTNDYTTAEKTKLSAITGTNTGDQTTITGNAGTATKLAVSKSINGIAFDGSADITVPAAAGTLTGIVAIANGGTNSTAVATAGGIGYGTGTAHAYTGAGTSGQLLSSNGAGVPSWVTPSTTATAYSGTLPGANGGTGVANTDKTITLGGNLTTSGAFATTLTTTAPTSITLPTSGTIATIAANVNVQTGTTYTLQDSDNGKVITLNNGSAITLTVPIGLSAGFNCLVVQLGAGAITFTASSTTIYNRGNNTKTAGQYAIATIVSYTSNTFITSGDMTQ